MMKSIRFEALNANHIISLNGETSEVSRWWLNQLLIRGWLANLEGKIPGLNSTQPFCIAAVEENRPLLIATSLMLEH